jgi:hypothetical protein
VAAVRQFGDYDSDADHRTGLVIVTERLRGVQPIFAIKPGATGDITLKATRRRTSSSRGARIAAGRTSRRPSSTAICCTCLASTASLAAYESKTGQRVYQERVGPAVVQRVTGAPRTGSSI